MSRAPTLANLLEDGRVHVFDGAMGTMLYARGVFVNVCYDELCVSLPELVEEVHELYVRSGAEVVETNTFGANPVKLSSYGLEDRTEEINRAAGIVARRAAGNRAAVVGAIGPLGVRVEPFGPTGLEEARHFYGRQVEGLLDGGVDGFVLETFSDLSELGQAVAAVQERCDLPVLAQITVGEDGQTSYGTTVEQFATEAERWSVDAVGLNCSVGPAVILDGLERMHEATGLPLAAQPNAGRPRIVGDRKMYLAGPEYMAQYARRMIEAGARFVGGCCGTTPEHVRRIREEVSSIQPRPVSVQVVRSVRDERELQPEVPLPDRSRWGARLAAGDFVTAVQLRPPRGWDPSELVEAARRLREAEVDALALFEHRRGSRMGVLSAAQILVSEGGIEPIVHYTCRGRTMSGMIADLLGGAAGGIRNLLLVSGEPPTTGPYPDTSRLLDIDSIGLTNVVHGLNLGVDPGGNALGPPTRFVVGVALNHGAPEVERELDRFRWKVEAGADFAVTQPVFELEAFQRTLESIEGDIPILAGVWPLTSLRNAEYLANEVPGVHVPDRVVGRMRKADALGPLAARAEGIRIAQEVCAGLPARVRGIQVTAPAERLGPALEVVAAVAGRRATRAR